MTVPQQELNLGWQADMQGTSEDNQLVRGSCEATE